MPIISYDCARYMYEGVDDDNTALSLMNPLSGEAASIMPSDYMRGTSIIDYVWEHESEIEQRQLGTKGSFPKIRWRPRMPPPPKKRNLRTAPPQKKPVVNNTIFLRIHVLSRPYIRHKIRGRRRKPII